MKYSFITDDLFAEITLPKASYKIFIPSQEDAISRGLLSTKTPYEIDMLAAMLNRLEPGDICLDIGANIGNHTLFLAAHGIRVIAFEANSDLCHLLDKSIKANGFSDLVTVHNLGLGGAYGTASLPEQSPGNLGGWHLHAGTDIKVVPLDSFTFPEKISAVKIDVERWEPFVFAGGKNTFLTHSPDIYCEINLGEMTHIYKMFNLLRDMDYVCVDHWQHLNNYLFTPYKKIAGLDSILKTIMYNQLFDSLKLKYLQESVIYTQRSINTLIANLSKNNN